MRHSQHFRSLSLPLQPQTPATPWLQCGFCGNACGAGEQCDAGTCKKVKVPKEAPGKGTCNSRGRSCYYSFFDSNLNWWVQCMWKWLHTGYNLSIFALLINAIPTPWLPSL